MTQLTEKSEQLQIQFDYTALDDPTRDFLIQTENEIEHILRESAYQIGTRLIAVKKRLPHGEFLKWLKARWGWTPRTAQNMMNVAQNFKSEIISHLISPTSLYLLARPSTPESAREEAIERAESGEKIDHNTAKEIADAHKRIQELEKQIEAEIKAIPEIAKAKNREALTRIRGILGDEQFKGYMKAFRESVKNLSRELTGDDFFLCVEFFPEEFREFLIEKQDG